MPDFPFDPSKFDLAKIMEMAKGFQERMQQLERTLARIQVESVVGGGMVTVVANARGEVISVKLDPELLAMNDKGMIENLVTSGVNQALAQARKRREEETRKLTGGMVPPGLTGILT